MDVWSLFVAIANIHHKFRFPPPRATTYADVLRAVRAAVLLEPALSPMVRENPDHRASAAQLLVALSEGRVLSTPRARVLPIAPKPSAPTVPAFVRAPHARARALANKPMAFPLVRYACGPHRRLDVVKEPSPLSRTLGGGITKRRAPRPPAWLLHQLVPVARAEYSPSDEAPAKKDPEDSFACPVLSQAEFAVQ